MKRAPLLHGLSSTFKIEKHVATALKIDPFISMFNAKEWSDPAKLAEAYITHYGTSAIDATKALREVGNTFNCIIMKRKGHLALRSYCEELKKYIKQEFFKKAFTDHFQEKLLDNELDRAGYINAQRLALIGSSSLGRKLQQRINQMPSSSNSITPASSSATSTSDPTASTSDPTASTPDPTAPTPDPAKSNIYQTLLTKRERDNIYVDELDAEQGLSIGTKIKRRALVKHDEYQQGNKITPVDRKIMSNGLSSIIDCIDLTSQGQAKLFREGSLEKFAKDITKKKQVQKFKIPASIEENWKLACMLSSKRGSVELAANYLEELKRITQSNYEKKIIGVFEKFIDLFVTHNKSLSSEKLLDKWTEYDFLVNIWGPIINSMLAINGSLLRLKSGESVNSNSTQMKNELYDSTRLIGFKIDLRFVHDMDDDEFDVGAGEVAKSTDANKMYHDLGKLLREGKDVVDGLLLCSLEDKVASKASGWVIQLCGLRGQISTVHLISDGLYTGVLQGKIRFPTSITDLETLTSTFCLLMTMITQMERHGQRIKAANTELENRRRSMGKNYNQLGDPLPGHSLSDHMRPTWYSPTRDESSYSRIPRGLFGSDDNNYDDQEEIIHKDASGISSSNNSSQNADDQDDTDEYGFYYQNGVWHNIHNNTKYMKHPLTSKEN